MSLPGAGHLLLAALAALAISGAAWRVRALNASGALAAAVVGFLLFGCGGWPGAVALLLFFLSSSALSRLGKRRKAALDYEKGGERDAGQVFANGGVAALCALLLPLLPHSMAVPAALLGAFATANADTWATEIGSLVAHPPRLITTLKPAPVGASGAVSLPGTVAALAGALLIAAVAPAFNLPPLHGILTVMAAGFAGALVDSLLGATLQIQYRCAECGKLTERTLHHDRPTLPVRGLSWMNNDAVNLLATASGSLLAALLIGNMV